VAGWHAVTVRAVSGKEHLTSANAPRRPNKYEPTEEENYCQHHPNLEVSV
jgi:hypothetical protein